MRCLVEIKPIFGTAKDLTEHGQNKILNIEVFSLNIYIFMIL